MAGLPIASSKKKTMKDSLAGRLWMLQLRAQAMLSFLKKESQSRKMPYWRMRPFARNEV